MDFELLPGYFQKDENIAIYVYHQHGLEGLKKLKEKWTEEGKGEYFIGFLDGLMAVRPTDPSRIVP